MRNLECKLHWEELCDTLLNCSSVSESQILLLYTLQLDSKPGKLALTAFEALYAGGLASASLGCPCRGHAEHASLGARRCHGQCAGSTESSAAGGRSGALDAAGASGVMLVRRGEHPPHRGDVR